MSWQSTNLNAEGQMTLDAMLPARCCATEETFAATWEQMPVFLTSAAHFADAGVDRLAIDLIMRLSEHGLDALPMPTLLNAQSTAARALSAWA